MTSAFDAYRTSYDAVVQDSIAFSGLEHGFFLDAKADLLADVFGRHFGTSRPSLLDVGCGVGLLHRRLAGIVSGMAGTDPSPESVARAESENPGNLYRLQQDGRVPFEDRAFDATLAVCVFHHVPVAERSGLLADMRRVTRPGGLVAIIEHNPWNPLTRLAVSRCPFDHDAVLLGARETRALLAERGLRDIRSRHFLAFPFRRGWVPGVEKAIGRMPLGAQFLACGTV
ncbi:MULTISPECIES: class I SAM-dependent methyltransferase [unclassified Methylobacterium]|uniref:class I SAM-dependent methyltransferase n=1 Tax=unclassified Methylobacterium TaxID=2615210 RepID=UPI000368FCF5|nr:MULTISPECIES: class I SAM-dependent methyltransferase [unclassified Methylobacterium]KQP52030.1 methylase [Methylobacterium sp. Leaf106]